MLLACLPAAMKHLMVLLLGYGPDTLNAVPVRDHTPKPLQGALTYRLCIYHFCCVLFEHIHLAYGAHLAPAQRCCN